VFNDEQQQAPNNNAPVEHNQPQEKQPKVELIDTPKHAALETALVVNLDQAQSEIVALNPQQVAAPASNKPKRHDRNEKAETVAKAPRVDAQPATAPAVESQAVTTEAKTPAAAEVQAEQPVQRASNDPRQKRRQQRDAAQAKAATPKIAPSQVPTLNQYTVGTLIRHVYGDDCAVLIEQFGLIPTFNRALVKFTEEYSATLTVVEKTDVQSKQPVTRDVAISKAAPEAQPADVLDLTPPKPENDRRVANDPRERRRLAKQAAVQAKQEHQAELEQQPEEVKTEIQASPVEAAPVVTQAEEVQAETPVETAVETAPAEVQVVKAAPAKSVEKAVVATEKAKKPQQSLALDTTAEAAVDEDAQKADNVATDEKPARPRRPRGRPPKKATPPADE